MTNIVDTIIIGAGIAGLAAAQVLQSQECSYLLLEKSDSVGGRLATYMTDKGLADYGLQFFTAYTDTFMTQVETWLAEGSIYEWGTEWSDGSIKRSFVDDKPCYAATGGMSEFVNTIASSLNNISLNTTVRDIRWTGEFWEVDSSKDELFIGRNLIMTTPAPIAINLLRNIPMQPTVTEALSRIHYTHCLSGIFVIDGNVNLPESGAKQVFTDSSNIYWIADNQAKGISPEETVLTVHGEKRFSKKHFNDADADILDSLSTAIAPYLSENTRIKSAELKRWQYSIPLTTYPHDILQDDVLPLIFAGDAFGGRGRFEGAYLSGVKAAERICADVVT